MSHSEQVRRLIDGGARFIQLREKRQSPAAWIDDAIEAVQAAHAAGAVVIINDRVDIAIAAGADGVHLGQGDLPPAEARKLMGDDAIIGFSTHTLEEAAAASKLPIDYIAFGPVFPSRTKDDPDPVVGHEILQIVRGIAGNIPVVAIGGINDTNLSSVLGLGADSAAMIGAILADPGKISQRFSQLLSIANSFVKHF